MQSEFYFDSTEGFPDEWSPIAAEGSERFRFYKARVHGRLHFVKTLSEAYQHDLRSIESLRKEFEIGYNLDHPNIVRYLRFADDALYEEYIDGKTLKEMLSEADPRLKSKNFIGNICRQLLEAVEYLHGKGVLHLDLKPGNVMVTRVGDKAKIIDFSCAYSPMADTTRGFTLQYRAPEQENGDGETNAYTDIYLIGKIIEELAAATDTSSKWARFIKKATADRPADRFRSEREAIEAIPGDKRKNFLIIALSLAGVIGGVALSFPFLHSSSAEKETALLAEQKADSVYLPTPAEPQDSFLTINNKAATAEKAVVAQPETRSLPQPVAVPAPASHEDITDKLGKMIDSHVSADYVANVKPVCQSDTAYTEELYTKMQAAFKAAQKRCFKYGDELAKRYPEHADFIQTKVYQAISTQQSRAAGWAGLL